MNSIQGNFTLYQDGQLIIYMASGTWNAEGSLACLRGIRQLINRVDQDEFGLLIDTSRGEGFNFECYEIWIDAIDEWYEQGLRAGIRLDNRTDMNYRIFSEPFDNIMIPLIGLGYSKNITSAVKVLNRRGFKGFESGLANATKISNCPDLGLPSNFMEPSVLR